MTTELKGLARNLLEGKNVGHLATLMKDGSPQSSVVWVDVDGNNILVNTEEGRAKPRNLRRDGRVALSIADAQNPYQAAFIRGKVKEITKEGAAAHIDKLAKKYMGVDVYPAHNPELSRLIVVIEPEHVSTMGE